MLEDPGRIPSALQTSLINLSYKYMKASTYFNLKENWTQAKFHTSAQIWDAQDFLAVWKRRYFILASEVPYTA